MSSRRWRHTKRWLRAHGRDAAVIGGAVVATGVLSVLAFQQPEAPDGPGAPLPTLTEQPEQLATVFIGDSITEDVAGGVNAESGARPWPMRIAVRPHSPWLQADNVAISGETTGQLLDRFQRDVLDQHPEAVVILAGTNDAALSVPPSEAAANLTKMIRQAEKSGVKVWTISPPPNDGYTDRVAAVVAAEQHAAEDAGVPFVNIFARLGEDGRWPDSSFTVDGTHPTPKGQQAIADVVFEAVRD